MIIDSSSFFNITNTQKAKKLTEEVKNVSDNAELCHIFNNYFSEIASNLKIPSSIK